MHITKSGEMGNGFMKVDRLVGMFMILLEKRRVGAQELAELFEVSPRTVCRDMEAINQAGIPVRSVPGVGGGFEIMPDYKVDKKAFSADDLSALLMGLNSLSGVMQGDALTHALAKARSFIPAEQTKANYYDMLLSLGDKCECLAPDRVRDELRRRIKRMARIYGE